MIRYIFGAYFKQFSLSFPDVNKNKGVAETTPVIGKKLGEFFISRNKFSKHCNMKLICTQNGNMCLDVKNKPSDWLSKQRNTTTLSWAHEPDAVIRVSHDFSFVTFQFQVELKMKNIRKNETVLRKREGAGKNERTERPLVLG